MSEFVSQVECQSHIGENCISYCLDCDCLACLPCILSPHFHQGHKCTSLKDIISERKNQAILNLDELKDKAVIFNQAITELKQNQEELESDSKTLKEQIEKRTENFHIELDQIKEELTSKLEAFLERENATLNADVEMLESESNKLKSLISFIDNQKQGESSYNMSDVTSIIHFASFLKPLRSSYLLTRPYFDSQNNGSLTKVFGHLQLDAEEEEVSSADRDQERQTDDTVDGSACTMTCVEEVNNKGEIRSIAEALRTSSGASTQQRIYATVEDEIGTPDPKEVSQSERRSLKPAEALRTSSGASTQPRIYATVEDEIGTLDPKEVSQSKRRSLKRAFLIRNQSVVDMSVRLCAGEDNTMWLTGYGSRNITQIRMDGSQVKRLQTSFEINDIGVNSKQEVFVTEKNGKNVRKFTKSLFSYRWSRFSSFPDMCTVTGICCTRNDNMFVCLQRHPVGGKIVEISAVGAHLRDIEFDMDGSSLFKLPRLIKQNHFNENICVIDDKSVVVVKDSKHLHFTWNGDTFQDFPKDQRSAHSKRVVPLGMDIDQYGHLYIADYGNGRVCEYNTDGEFVKVVKDEVHHVSGLAIDTSGFLWIAGAGGNLFVKDIKENSSNL